jgi:hypothetical protein
MVEMGAVWDRAVEFLSDHVGVVTPIAILAILVPTSISGSLEPLQITGGESVRIGLGVLALGFAVLQVWGQLAITALAIDPVIGPRANQVATARLLPAIGIFLLLFVAVLVIAAPVAVMLAAAGVDLTSLSPGQRNPIDIPPSVGIGVLVYGLVMAIVLLFFAVRLVPLTPVIVAEQRGLGAIPRAFALSRGIALKLFGVLILYAIVATVAILAVRTVFGSVLGLLGGNDCNVSVATVVTAIAVAAVSTALTVLATAFVAKLYVAIMRGREAAAPPAPGPDAA